MTSIVNSESLSVTDVEEDAATRPSVLVVLPTYNERENVRPITGAVLEALPSSDIWIVDDNSPDGTGRIADELAAEDHRVRAVHRSGKAGLGTAYLESFNQALAEGYKYVVTMDADFSHDPKILPDLLYDASKCDLVVGSRYVPGGSTPDWVWYRKMLSRVGNLVATVTLGLPVHDATTGYRVFNRNALREMRLEAMGLQGYGFMVETIYQCHQAKLRILEHPITFIDRRQGHSKMSRAIILEALVYVVRRRFRDLFGDPEVKNTSPSRPLSTLAPEREEAHADERA